MINSSIDNFNKCLKIDTDEGNVKQANENAMDLPRALTLQIHTRKISLFHGLIKIKRHWHQSPCASGKKL